jgi:hypothetical protein
MRIEQKSTSIWVIWSLIVLAVTGIHALTIQTSPLIWQDEVQIIDYGRSFFDGPNSNWSVSWSAADRPTGFPSYLGPAIQEFGFRAGGGDVAGPRATALFGAILASAAMLGWLRARSLDWRVALACSLLFFLDPVYAQGYRGARVDAWCMGVMLLGLWAIRAMPSRGALQRSVWMPRQGHIVAAVCVAISGLIWTSAILLIPLLIHELTSNRKQAPGAGVAGNRLWRCSEMAWVGALSVVMCGLLLLPIWQIIHQSFCDLATTTSAVSDPNRTATSAGNLVKSCAEAFKYSPWVLLVGFAGCVSLKRWALGLAMLAALLGAVHTGFYVHRGVYLLPYLFLAIAMASDRLLHAASTPVIRRLVFGILTGMFVWSSGVTLVARTVIALKQRDERDSRRLQDLANRAIGPGTHRVYLGSWESYYAGRQLGWRLFRFFRGAQPGDPIWNRLMETMDYAIFRTDYITAKDHEALTALGFTRERFDCTEDGVLSAKQPNPDPGYGAYWVYRRQ